MNLIYHRGVQGDVATVLRYYDEVGGSGLSEAFFDDFMRHVSLVVENPARFHRVDGDLRRANLDRFPYHFLYRVQGDTVRILVVRHHQRDPDHGIKRS